MFSINTKKALSFTLALVLSATIIPATCSSIRVSAESGKVITGLGTGTITNPKEGNGNWDYVYYGKYNGDVVKYRVLDKDSKDYGSDTILLDCDNILYDLAPGVSALSADDFTGLMKNLNDDGFLNKNDVFTDAEKKAIAYSAKTSNSSTDGNGEEGKFSKLTNNKIFALDPKEATNTSYGYKNNSYHLDLDNLDSNRIKTYQNGSGKKGSWWLRLEEDSKVLSKVTKTAKGYVVNELGNIKERNLSDSEGVSPAFNVSLSSILFSSLVPNTTNEYKLTIIDDSMPKILSSKINGKLTGKEEIVSFEFPSTEVDDKISFSVLLLKDKYVAGKVITSASDYKYIPLATSKAASGDSTAEFTMLTGQFTVPDGCENFYPYLICEKVGGSKETDYASTPVHFDLDSNNHKHEWKITESKGDKITTAADKVALITCTECDAAYAVSLDAQSKIYDGKLPKTEVKKEVKRAAKNSKDFPDEIKVSDVAYKYHNDSNALTEKDSCNCGEYDAVVRITAGEATAVIKDDFKIEQRPITPKMITLSEKKYVYDGTEKKPEVKVSLDNIVLAENVDYEVQYKDNVEPGIGKVVVTAISSNFTGKAEETFIIQKEETSKVEAKKQELADKDLKKDTEDLLDKVKDKHKKESTNTNTNANKQQTPTVIEVPSTVNAEPRHKVGDKIIDGGNTYIITSITEEDMTVKFAEPKSASVKSISIPLSIFDDNAEYRVTEIAANAFKGNKKLEKVTIGENVAKIGKNAFYNCKKLKNIKIKTNNLKKKSIGKNAFKNIHPKATVKVPKKKVNSYKKLLKSKGLNGKKQKVTK